MSFRIRKVVMCSGAGEKTYTICITDFASRIRFLLTRERKIPALFVRNDNLFEK
jgi:hypothetical protein